MFLRGIRWSRKCNRTCLSTPPSVPQSLPQGWRVQPAGIQTFLTRWAVAPQTVAYVGDAPYDMDAAHQAEGIAVAAAWAASANAVALI